MIASESLSAPAFLPLRGHSNVVQTQPSAGFSFSQRPQTRLPMPAANLASEMLMIFNLINLQTEPIDDLLDLVTRSVTK